MEISAAPNAVSLPTYFVNYTGGTVVGFLPANSSRSHLLTILTHTTSHPIVSGPNTERGNKGSLSDNDEDDDTFGEHYFHICIYIWACVVISSLIALSVKWGCCGRSLTRWEVKRIPLKRFQKVDGEDSQEKCPICHEEFHEERLIRQLPCNHCYHSYCVDRWLVKMSNRCPLCKQRVSISLLCPWNKQRRKKEITGHMSPDMEASIDESPPLPPLSTLTPSNWFGEKIMSGPSKFIIMRPGKPTRVIDIREKKKLTVTSSLNCEDNDGPLEQSDINVPKCNYQHFDKSVTEQNCTKDGCLVSSINNASNNDISEMPLLELEDVLNVDMKIPSVCSSRSCSISSDQPLLFQSQCNFGCDSGGHDESGNLRMSATTLSDDAIKWCIALTPLVHSSHEVSEHSQCFTVELGCTSSPIQDDSDQISTTKSVVTLSSRSSSVLSCNMKTSGSSPDLTDPLSNRTSPTPHQPTIFATLDWSRYPPECTSLIPTHYNKYQNSPGQITESLMPLPLNTSNSSTNNYHPCFSKSAAVYDKTINL